MSAPISACVWATASQSGNGAACDFVLGQQGFAGQEHNRAGYHPDACALSMPYGLTVQGNRLIVADTAGVPGTARTKAQELIENINVHCIIGPLAAFEALAIADYLNEKQMPTLGVSAAEDMTQRHPSPWFVRLTSTSAQCASR